MTTSTKLKSQKTKECQVQWTSHNFYKVKITAKFHFHRILINEPILISREEFFNTFFIETEENVLNK